MPNIFPKSLAKSLPKSLFRNLVQQSRSWANSSHRSRIPGLSLQISPVAGPTRQIWGATGVLNSVRLKRYDNQVDNGPLLRLTAEAARHHGAFTRQQALDAGFSRSAISRRVQSMAWSRPSPEVYLFPGTPATWQRSVVIAVYGSGSGAVASHATAAHLWGLRKHGVTGRARVYPGNP